MYLILLDELDHVCTNLVLIGLAQAAAARGGETVLSNAPQMPSLSDRMAEEEGEATAVNANNSNSSHIVASSTSLSISNGTNNVLSSVYTAATTTMASPALQRQGKGLDLDSLKYTPQKCLEDKGYVICFLNIVVGQ